MKLIYFVSFAGFAQWSKYQRSCTSWGLHMLLSKSCWIWEEGSSPSQSHDCRYGLRKNNNYFLDRERTLYILAVKTWTEKQKKIPNAITLTAQAKILAIKKQIHWRMLNVYKWPPHFHDKKRMFISFYDNMTLWNRSKTQPCKYMSPFWQINQK